MPRSVNEERLNDSEAEELESFRRVMTALGDALFTTMSVAVRPTQDGKNTVLTRWVIFGDEIWRHTRNNDEGGELSGT